MAPTPRTNAEEASGLKRRSEPALSFARRWVPLVLGLSVVACSTVNSVGNSLFGTGGPALGQPGYVKGFLGEVVADEPRAALAGREVLSGGGNAADAAVAIGLSLGVTLPSRAGLGGGGACIAYTADTRGAAKGAPEAIIFVPPPSRSLGSGDRSAAVPMLARGMFLLHARHGKQPFETMVSKAEQLARFGVPVSRALARDLVLVAGPLFADPSAHAVFGAGGAPLTEGQGLVQPELAATLAQLRVAGVGDLYQGMLARRIELASPSAGVPIGVADLRAALPAVSVPVVIPFGDDKVAFPPTEGGLAAAASLMSLKSRPADLQGALMRGLGAAASWRTGGANSDQVLSGALVASTVPLYPASTTFATLDPDGNAVVCALTMNNLFGAGRMIPGLGFLAAASPASVTPPLLSAGLVWNEHTHAFHAEAGGSGQAGAALATAVALSNALRSGQPMPNVVPEPGRANVIFCSRYLPGSQSSCTAVADPREFGLAAGGSQ
jgi:gamma-glutamyltranspeptidase/glutathione hydrolase